MSDPEQGEKKLPRSWETVELVKHLFDEQEAAQMEAALRLLELEVRVLYLRADDSRREVAFATALERMRELTTDKTKRRQVLEGLQSSISLSGLSDF